MDPVQECEIQEQQIEECQAEIRRLRSVIREMGKSYVEYPFPQGSKVFGIATYCEYRKLVYMPEQCYYVAPYHDSYDGEHVIAELMGGFKVVKDVFRTKEEAEKYIEDNNLNS